ncbi:hypothetical protein ACQ1QN_11565, partial [Ornithobacterium rhinotracheale]
MIPEVNRQFWKKLDKDLKDNLHRRLLNEAGDRALRFSKERFRQKNWVDTTPQKWKPRQRRDSGSLLVRSVRLVSFVIVFYLLPGIWGAPLKIVDGLIP